MACCSFNNNCGCGGCRDNGCGQSYLNNTYVERFIPIAEEMAAYNSNGCGGCGNYCGCSNYCGCGCGCGCSCGCGC